MSRDRLSPLIVAVVVANKAGAAALRYGSFPLFHHVAAGLREERGHVEDREESDLGQRILLPSWIGAHSGSVGTF